MELDVIYNEDCITGMRKLPNNCVDCCVTSPPYYGLRDYGVEGQIGLEDTPEQYVAKMVEVFREVRRVLKPEGTLWLNLGDSYVSSATGSTTDASTLGGGKATQNAAANRPEKAGFGLPAKNLLGIPWRVAFALQADGWYLRQDIIWAKPNPMPESVTDRCTKAHEYIFLMTKSARYYYDAEAVAEEAKYKPGGSHSDVKQGGFNDKGEIPGSGQRSFRAIRETINKRSVWSVTTTPYGEAHFATFPEKLIEPCILAGCPKDGIVLDPFMGSGTTGRVAVKFSRHFIGYELNPEYIKLCEKRTDNVQLRMV